MIANLLPEGSVITTIKSYEIIRCQEIKDKRSFNDYYWLFKYARPVSSYILVLGNEIVAPNTPVVTIALIESVGTRIPLTNIGYWNNQIWATQSTCIEFIPNTWPIGLFLQGMDDTDKRILETAETSGLWTQLIGYSRTIDYGKRSGSVKLE